MALISILLPKLGESVAEATITKWLKQVGDRIEKDETIADVATDKVDTELPSEYEGVIREILIAEGGVAAVGTAIAIIETDGDLTNTKNAQEHKIEQAPTINVTDSNQSQPTQPKTSSKSQRTTLGSTSNIKDNNKSGLYLTPVVRNIAREAGLTPADLANISPTGSNNSRITKKDILHYLSPPEVSLGAPSKRRLLKKEPNDHVVQLNRMRKLIAKHMSESVQTAAHVTSWVITDVSEIVKWREEHKQDFNAKHKVKLTYTHVFMALVIESLLQYPKLNAWFDGEDELVIKGDINLGFAAVTPDDNLIVPNIKTSNTKTLVEIVSAVNTLGHAAKTKQLKSNDIENTTFTVSNTGIFGSQMGTPILALPQVAIMALGEIASAPGIVTKDGVETISIIKQMNLSLSYDHRVIDGAYASKFLKDLQGRIARFKEMSY